MDPGIPGSMSDFYETPSLEGLAAQGTRFSAGYSAGPNCAPSRASIETGRSPAQLRLTDNPGSFPPEVMTIAEIIKAEAPDYVTGHFGKWPLGAGGPGAHGYDQHDNGTFHPAARDPNTNPKDIFGISDRAEAFIEAQVAAGRSFYLVISHHAVHTPAEALPGTIDYYAQKPPGVKHSHVEYAAMTDDLDFGLDRIIGKLEDLGIEDRTYLVYTSDNGATGQPGYLSSNAPLKRGKTTLWEGGIRVPFVFVGPGIVPGRVESEVPAIGWDLLPTILDWIGIADAVPNGLEGRSLRRLLEGSEPALNVCGSSSDTRHQLAWHFPHWRTDRQIEPHSAIRWDDCQGSYKAVHFYKTHWETQRLQLYDLLNDPGETNDIAALEPELAEELENHLFDYLGEVGAPCPNDDPEVGPLCPNPKPVSSGGGGSWRCGLGAELALLLPPLLWLSMRRRRRS
jgi:arylsulfatase A-like enzyme